MTNISKEIKDMKAYDLIEKLSNVIRRTSLQLYYHNKYAENGAQELKDIRLLANKKELRDAIYHMGEVFHVIKALSVLNDEDVTDKTSRHIVGMMTLRDNS